MLRAFLMSVGVGFGSAQPPGVIECRSLIGTRSLSGVEGWLENRSGILLLRCRIV
ncbi:MAG: hypothetical protein AAFP07_22500 [Cyanobacteria bacterium J06606_4]